LKASDYVVLALLLAGAGFAAYKFVPVWTARSVVQEKIDEAVDNVGEALSDFFW